MMKLAFTLTIAICICISIVSAGSDYCDPYPNDITTSIVHEGNWFNITFTSPACYVCVDNGAMMGDVECTPCSTSLFTSNVTCGLGTFAVQFTETTGYDNATTTYYWDFGDGNTSTEQNPVNLYSYTGVFDVDFHVIGIGSDEWSNKTGYMKARAIGDTCAATAKRYTSTVTSDPSMTYIMAFGGFFLLMVVFVLAMMRRR